MMDDRAVSVAVTHTLTLGVTTVLIVGLLLSTGTMLDVEQDRAATDAGETVGERLAGEIAAVDRLADEESTTRLEVRTNHPRTLAGSGYTVTLIDGAENDCDGLTRDADACLRLVSPQMSDDVYVPLAIANDVDDGATAPGGEILIEYDGNITIGGA